jgi:large subunit ribosomal protein L35
MPKMKTHRGAAKRFKKTAKGKLVHAKQGRRHFMAKRSRKRNRHLREEGQLQGGDAKKIARLVPYL